MRKKVRKSKEQKEIDLLLKQVEMLMKRVAELEARERKVNSPCPYPHYDPYPYNHLYWPTPKFPYSPWTYVTSGSDDNIAGSTTSGCTIDNETDDGTGMVAV